MTKCESYDQLGLIKITSIKLGGIGKKVSTYVLPCLFSSLCDKHNVGYMTDSNIGITLHCRQNNREAVDKGCVQYKEFQKLLIRNTTLEVENQ